MLREVDQTLLEHGLKIRANAQDHMVAVSSGALALSVTFSGLITQHSHAGLWLLRTCWVAFALCVVLVVIEKVASSAGMLELVGEPRKELKAGSAKYLARYILTIFAHNGSLVAFALGIVALAAYGLASL